MLTAYHVNDIEDTPVPLIADFDPDKTYNLIVRQSGTLNAVMGDEEVTASTGVLVSLNSSTNGVLNNVNDQVYAVRANSASMDTAALNVFVWTG